MPTLYYFHDPMCSWCWAYRPVSDYISTAMAERLSIVKIVGGLAPDSDAPMPYEMRDYLQKTWRQIAQILGTDFNFDFWERCEPRRSTYPACRAVIAAGLQNAYDPMLDAIQRAYYLDARNPSDLVTLVALAGEIGLDAERFSDDILAPSTEAILQQQIGLTAAAGIGGFPTLALALNDELHALHRDYSDAEPTLGHIEQLLAR